MTAMKTFDNTRPLVAAMAIGIGRAAYDVRARLRERELRPRRAPSRATRRIAERLARIGRRLEAARMAHVARGVAGRRGQPERQGGEHGARPWPAGARFAPASRRSRSAARRGRIATEHQLLEKWFRDIKVYDIFEGTGQIQRIVVSKRLMPDLKSF